MANFDGNIIIGTSVDVGGINTGLNKISNQFRKLSRLSSSILGVTAFVKFGKAALDAASDLQEVQNIVDVAFGDMSYKIEKFTDTCIDKFGISELAAKQTAGSFMAMGKSVELTSKEASDMAVKLTALTGDFSSFYNISQDYSRVAMSAVYTGETETLKRYGIIMTEANLQQYAHTLGIEKSIKSMGAREKVLLRYNYLLKATTFIEGDFVRTQNSWANQIRVLQERWKQFLIVLGSGLITVLTPLVKTLNSIVTALTNFAKTLGAILSELFGIDFQDITQQGSSGMEDIAESATDAEEATKAAAKAAKMYLSPIDELNRYASASKSGSSGLGLGDINTETVEKGAQSLAEKIKSQIDSLFELGEYLGQKIIDMLDSIDWESIFKRAEIIGRGLAEFLNGLFSPELFGKLGSSLANVLNTAIYFALAFIEEFSWADFGASIASGINELFLTFDFSSLASTIANFWNGLLTTMLVMAKEIKWEEIGKTIADAVNVFFDTFDFKLLAQTINAWVDGIKDFIKEFIDTVEWEDVFSGISEFLSELDVDTVSIIVGYMVIKKILKLKLAESVLSAISKSLASAIGANVGLDLASDAGIGAALIAAFKKGVASLTAQIPTLLSGLPATIGEFFTLRLPMLIGSISGGFSVLFENLALGNTLSASLGYAFGPLVPIISGIIALVSGALLAIVSFVSMITDKFSWLKEILMVVGIALAAIGAVLLGVVTGPVAAIIAAIVAAVATAVILIKDSWSAIVENVVAAWDFVSGIFITIATWINDNVIQPLISFFVGVYVRVSQIFEGLWIIIKAIWIVASSWFTEKVITPLVGAFTFVRDKISEFLKNAWENIKIVWAFVSGWFNTKVIQPLIKFFTPIVETISGIFKKAIYNIKLAWALVVGWFTTKVIEPIASLFKNLWNGIGSGIEFILNGIISGLEGAINWIISGINNLLSMFNKVVTASAKITGDSWGGVSLVPSVSLSRISIPKLATGAVLPANSPFMALVGDQKSGTNVEAPLSTIKQALVEALEGFGSTASTNVNLILDGMQVARAVIKNGKVIQITNGSNPFELN